MRFRSPSESDSSNYEKRDDTTDNMDNTSNSAEIRKMQADLDTLNQSVKEIKDNIERLIQVINLIIHS